jgi:hypothetical protein
MMEVLEIVVVCDPSYRDIFEGVLQTCLDSDYKLVTDVFQFFVKNKIRVLLIEILLVKDLS